MASATASLLGPKDTLANKMAASVDTFNLGQEVKLATTNADRDHFESLANLCGIIVALDYLERAYVRDSVTQDAYALECKRLIAQYRTVVKVLGDQVPSLEAFVSEYRMDCSAAVHRLRVGVPATVEHSAQEGLETSKWIAETTQNFITLLDAIKLKMKAKDQLQPIMTELMNGYSKFEKSSEWQGRPKLVHWLITLNQMRASDELTDDQSRQMAFDVEQAYTEFFSHLK